MRRFVSNFNYTHRQWIISIHTHTHETKRNTKMSATWNELRRMNHFGFRVIFQNENRARKWERRQNLFWIQMKREKIDVFDESMPFFSSCVASQWWPNLKQQQLAEKQKKPKERIVRARAFVALTLLLREFRWMAMCGNFSLQTSP